MAYTANFDRREGAGPACGEWRHRRGGPWHPASIVLIVLGFILWWPIGLAFLFYTIWSRKMGCWNRDAADRWQGKFEHKMEKMRAKMERHGFGAFGEQPSSGNRAFDEYRMETLRRLEDEQREFKDFLDRLRHAKDKAEFDQFMAERRAKPPVVTPNEPPAPQM